MTKILIGVDGSDRSHDAIAFGRALALAAGAPVVLATAHLPEPRQPPLDRHGPDTGLRAEAEALLARASLALLDLDDVKRLPLAGQSAAKALQSAAEHAGAGIVVVGSSHVGRLGRVLPGSTAERLLHHAPCPVAVVPLGFQAHGLPRNPAIGCAYQADDDGDTALAAAEELALALSGSLRVVQVVEPPSYLYDTGELPLNMPEIDARIRADAERRLAERVERLSFRLHDVEGTLHVGKPADVLAAISETVDTMVIGSRGYGPLKAVMVGGVSGQVIRSAACPVIVVPRGARCTIGSLFGPPTAAAAAGWKAVGRTTR
ncbi:MAG: universal stress protein [Actinomycetota bacterium]|nr:universal stress protein [Actinomycetota bacterium]